ncbi:MAG: hypothetical protein ACP5U0_08195 [Caldisphaera sp.]
MIRDVIVQAGGLGTRMGKYTLNRPKCLISLNGINILQTVNIGFPDANLHIIGDYKFEVLQAYLENINHGLKYKLYKAKGKGTIAGIGEVLFNIPKDSPVAITWSDLFFTERVIIPNENENFVVLSNINKCRYKYENGKFLKQETFRDGIIGVFIFNNRKVLDDIPSEGEFVEFLKEQNIKLSPIIQDSIIELGTADKLEHYIKNTFNTRFFNKIREEGNFLIKESRDLNRAQMVKDEAEWYKYMVSHSYKGIPRIISYDPLTMERIDGFHPFTPITLGDEEKGEIVRKILNELEFIHSIQRMPWDDQSTYDVYVMKTAERIKPVTKLLHLENERKLIINGKKVTPLTPNARQVLDSIYRRINKNGYFVPIHGDPTFSNILITFTGQVKFIDPRGYFGSIKIFGDKLYDYAKLYYSAVGNYDQFNIQNYILKKDGNEFTLKIGSSGFESTKSIFEEMFGNKITDIELLHSLIWLSLSGYLLNDLDGLIASYIHGLELLDKLEVEI